MRDGRCVAYCGWLSAAAVGTLRSARANAHRTSALRARILGAGTHLPVRWTKTFTARTSSRFFAIRLAHISGVGWSLGRLGGKTYTAVVTPRAQEHIQFPVFSSSLSPPTMLYFLRPPGSGSQNSNPRWTRVGDSDSPETTRRQ